MIMMALLASTCRLAARSWANPAPSSLSSLTSILVHHFSTSGTSRSNAHVKTHTAAALSDEAPAFILKHSTATAADWIQARLRVDGEQWRSDWRSQGYCVIEDLLDAATVEVYQQFYTDFLSGAINASAHRHDLGSNEEQHLESSENITQIMWPSDYVRFMVEGPLHARTLAIARWLEGDDMAFDFDMLIAKAPGSSTAVPWHSDEGYWPDMPDKRAASCWVALDQADVENGCMWFVPGSHLQPLRQHEAAAKGAHVLQAAGVSDADGVPVPLRPGSCTIHTGRTLHYTRGNTTQRHRRAFITNFRPQAMVEWERANAFDHARGGLDAMESGERDTTVRKVVQ